MAMRDWLTKDLHWKAFSILMAVGIWLTVHRIGGEPATTVSNSSTITYRLSVKAVSANVDVRTAQIVPPMVNITVSGSPDIMNRLQEQQIHAFVDLSDASSAINSPRQVEVSLPRGATVVDADPSEVFVTLAKQQ
jgi:YbbR domain-containing protein